MPETLTLDGKTVTLFTARGTIVGERKWATTEVSGGGATAQGASNPVRSETTEHDQFFLKTADDREISVTLAGAGLALRTGHDVSVFWAVPSGKEEGPFVVVHNHTTNDTTPIKNGLKALFGPGDITWIAIMFVMVVAGWVAVGQLWALVSGGDPILSSLIGLAVFGSILWFGWRYLATRKRRKKALVEAVQAAIRNVAPLKAAGS